MKKNIKNRIIALVISISTLLSLSSSKSLKDVEIDSEGINLEDSSLDEYYQYIKKYKVNYDFDNLGLNTDEAKEIYNYEATPCFSYTPKNVNKILWQIYLNRDVDTNLIEPYYFREYEVNTYDVYLKWQEIEGNNKDKLHSSYLFTNALQYIIAYLCRNNELKGDDLHVLSNLVIKVDKINQRGILGNYYPGEYKIIIDMDKILEFSIKRDYKYDFEDVDSYAFFNYYYSNLLKTLWHEINHARQDKCECRRDSEQECLRFSNLNLNFLIESSAESYIQNCGNYPYNKKTTNDYSYLTARKKEATLLLLGMFNNTSIDKYYQAINSQNVKDLYNYWNVVKLKDIKRLDRILYYLDGLEGYNNFNNKINIDPNDSAFDIEIKCGSEYRIDLFLMILERLQEYAKLNSDFTLDEHIWTYLIIRNIILSNSYKIRTLDDNTDSDIIIDEDLKDYIYKIEKEYIDYLGSKYNEVYGIVTGLFNVYEDYIIKLMNNFYIRDEEYDEITSIKNYLLERFPTLEIILSQAIYDTSTMNYLRYINNKEELSLKK